MANFTLTIAGPKPATQHINAHDVDGAMALAREAIEADYGTEGDPAILRAKVTIASEEKEYRSYTVAGLLGRKV